jgi:DNA polymerase III subunit gamma/tau
MVRLHGTCDDLRISGNGVRISGDGVRPLRTPPLQSWAMATQSLYRRYRPQKFSEIRGQEHVVKALRNAVASGHEGQAYLFSGPRGTGKTSAARILAKALNCANPQDGEPCCECESCVAIQEGSSFDVVELDAASNRGIDKMRDVISSVNLVSPGRHKVYILDEVHQLTKEAASALLKTLEEPPSHVVFVLATTDPEKVFDTIRSRTQHLQFHLLSMADLDSYVRYVIDDAKIELGDDAVEAVLRQGAGSARDTLSALELVAAMGGVLDETTPVDEFVEALIDYEAGALLAAVARSIDFGLDPRTIAEDLIRHMRDCFLVLMAPDVLDVVPGRRDTLTDQANRLGAPRVVKIIETLGSTVLDMRNAPDSRVLLEVSLVRLVHRELQMGIESLLARIERLEKAMEERPALAPAPKDPTTGRAVLGGRVNAETGPARRPQATTAPVAEPSGDEPAPAPPVTVETAPASVPTGSGDVDIVVDRWITDVVGGLSGMRRAVAQMAKPMARDGIVVLMVDNEPSAERVRTYLKDLTATITKVAGGRCTIEIEVRSDDSRPIKKPSSSDAVGRSTAMNAPDESGVDEVPEDEFIDIEDVKSLPTVSTETVTDQLTSLFPGSEIISEDL